MVKKRLKGRFEILVACTYGRCQASRMPRVKSRRRHLPPHDFTGTACKRLTDSQGLVNLVAQAVKAQILPARVLVISASHAANACHVAASTVNTVTNSTLNPQPGALNPRRLLSRSTHAKGQGRPLGSQPWPNTQKAPRASCQPNKLHNIKLKALA